ncbi:hypothetical protein EGW08_021165, partial [Elysia chlorotica]
ERDGERGTKREARRGAGRGREKEREKGILVVCWQDQVFRSCRSLEYGLNSSKDRVAAFIDNLTEQVTTPTQPAAAFLPDQSRPDEAAIAGVSDLGGETETRGDATRTSHCGGETLGVRTTDNPEDENPRWEFRLDADQLELFLSCFQLAKNKLQGRGFPV